MSRIARIALLQLPAFSVDQAEESLQYTLRRIDEAATDSPDIIVLPEVTYPAYFLGGTDTDTLTVSPADALAQIADRARTHDTYIAAGVAMPASGGALTNSAALIGRDGSLVGRYDKSFLWHFDDRWFAPGTVYPVFETDFGRIGMLICADGRLPEIARSLVLNGAQLILDLTAWVSGHRDPALLSSVQLDYLMPVRAAENGVWIACANKFGVEAESIVYCGRSCVINPRGEIVVTLDTTDAATLTYDIPIGDALPPIMRRPELYDALTQPTESLPVVRQLDEPIAVASEEARVSALQLTMPADGTTFLQLARKHAERLALHHTDALVFPATPGRYRRAYSHDAVVSGMLTLAVETEMMLAFTVNEGANAEGCRVMYLVGPSGIVAAQRQSHKPPGEKSEDMPMGDGLSPVVNTRIGRIALLCGAEAFVPEVPRSLMLRGAEVLLWSLDNPGIPMAPIARARADENRVFLACAGAPTVTGTAMIVDPAGRVLARALEGAELSVSATVNRAFTHAKAMAPGTDVVRNRQPTTYGTLTEATDRARQTVI